MVFTLGVSLPTDVVQAVNISARNCSTETNRYECLRSSVAVIFLMLMSSLCSTDKLSPNQLQALLAYPANAAMHPARGKWMAIGKLISHLYAFPTLELPHGVQMDNDEMVHSTTPTVRPNLSVQDRQIRPDLQLNQKSHLSAKENRAQPFESASPFPVGTRRAIKWLPFEAEADQIAALFPQSNPMSNTQKLCSENDGQRHDRSCEIALVMRLKLGKRNPIVKYHVHNQ